MKLEQLPLSKYYFESSNDFFVLFLKMLLPAIIGSLLYFMFSEHVMSSIFMGIIIFMFPVFVYQASGDTKQNWSEYVALIFSFGLILLLLFIIDIIISPFIWIYNKNNYISIKDLFEGKIRHAKIYSYVFKKEHEKQLSDNSLLGDLFLQVVRRQLGQSFFHSPHNGLSRDADIRDKAHLDKQTACVFKITCTDTKKIAWITWYFVIFETYEDFKPAIIKVEHMMFSETENGAMEELRKFTSGNRATVALKNTNDGENTP